MIKEVIRPKKPYFEAIVKELLMMKETLGDRKQQAIEEAIKQVENDFAEQIAEIDEALNPIVVIEQVVEDDVEEAEDKIVENGEVVEGEIAETGIGIA